MAILYRLTVNNPNAGTVDNWPPQIKESAWFDTYKSKMHPNIRPGVREAYFSDVAAFETWVNTNRLTDNTLIAAVDEWKSAYGISFTEEFYEIPPYTPGIAGLFG